MAFYDKVKERIKNGGKDKDDNEAERGGNVSFDQLIENAKQAKDEKDDEPDETQIEDLSGAQNKDYGDPSRIELKEDKPSQSQQKQGEKQSQARPRQEPQQAGQQPGQQPERTGTAQHGTERPESRHVSPQEGATAQTGQPQPSQPEQHRPQAGHEEKPQHRPQEGSRSVQEEQDTKQEEESTGSAVLGVLEEIRDQNAEMIDLLRRMEQQR